MVDIPINIEPRGPRAYTKIKQQLYGIRREIDHNPEAITITERVATTGALRRGTREALTTHADRFYSLHTLDEIENKLGEESLKQTGTWTERQAISEMYLEALRSAKKIDRIKADIFGADTLSPESNMLETLVTEKMGWHVGTKYAAYLEQHPEYIQELITLSTNLIAEDEQVPQWFAAKSIMFVNGLQDAVMLHRQTTLTPETDSTNVTELEEDNNALMERVNILRKYGVASVVAPGLSPHINQWLVTDPATERATMQETKARSLYELLPPNIARFAATSGKFKSSIMKAHEIDQPAAKTSYTSFTDVLEPNSKVVVNVALSRDGELLTRNGMPIKPFIEHFSHNLSGYEVTRAETLSILADLVVPDTFIRELEEQPDQSTPPTPDASPTQPDDRQSKLRKLVLARLRLIDENREQIIQTLEADQETIPEGVILPEESPQGTLRRNVINHLRTLPRGYRASPQARQRAWEEEKIILPETGVTYVKRQKKDNDTSPGQIAQLRHPSDARRPTEEPRRKEN